MKEQGRERQGDGGYAAAATAQAALDDLRFVELAQEEEMIRLAMERSMNDSVKASQFSDFSLDSAVAKSVPVDKKRKELVVDSPSATTVRSLSSSELVEGAGRSPLAHSPSAVRSLSSRQLLENVGRSSLLEGRSLSSRRLNEAEDSNCRSWSSAAHLPLRPSLKNASTGRFGRQRPDVLESYLQQMSQRSLLSQKSSTVSNPLSIDHEAIDEDDLNTMFDLDPVDPQTTTDTHEDMFDLDPDSPTRTPQLVEPVDEGGSVLHSTSAPPFVTTPEAIMCAIRTRLDPECRSLVCPSRSSVATLPVAGGISSNNETFQKTSKKRLACLEEVATHLSSQELVEIERTLCEADCGSSPADKRGGSEIAAGAVASSEVPPPVPAAIAIVSSVSNKYDWKGAEDHLTEEELRQIQQALHESGNVEQAEADGEELNSKRASLAAHGTSISSFDAATIERAVREADIAEELQSLQLALQMQEEEESQHREGIAARRRQGNVRTLTRVEWDAEKSGRAGASPPRMRHSREETGEIPPAAGFRMNASRTQDWARRDQNSVVGPNNEIRTKHDADLDGVANAERLGLEVTDHCSVRVGNKAYNSFIQSTRKPRKGSLAQSSRARHTSDLDDDKTEESGES